MSDLSVHLADNAFDLFHGSEQDRKDILAAHKAYLEANTNNLNVEDLRKTWSDDPNCVFFNGTGYNYYGIEDWKNLWEYYRPQVNIVEPWRSFDVRLAGNSEISIVTCIRTATGCWLGRDEEPEWTKKSWRSRSTEVFRKMNGSWKCIHIHISTEADGPRHDQRSA